MNRIFLPQRITNYYETIHSIAKEIEAKQPLWTINQLCTLIKQRYEIHAGSFEKQIILHLQQLVMNKYLQYYANDSNESRYSFGFYLENKDEE